MNTSRLSAFAFLALFAGALGLRAAACFAGQANEFEIFADLENPGHESDTSSFQAVAVRLPWVYALANGWSFRGGRLHIFRVPDETAKADIDDERLPKFKPIKVIEGIGDGWNLVRWDKVLVCTRSGGLEVYSLDDPAWPTLLARVTPTSKTKFVSPAVVRDGNRAYVIGYSRIVCYDLSEPSQPRCLAEKATNCQGFAGCMSSGYLYVGGARTKGETKQEGVAVLDPTTLAEIAFVPISHRAYHLFPIPGRRLLVSMDGDERVHSYFPPLREPSGDVAILDLSRTGHPSLVREIKHSGARMATMLTIGDTPYFVCEAAVYSVEDKTLKKVASFWDCGSAMSGFPFHGDSDGTYAALPSSEKVVLLRKAIERRPESHRVGPPEPKMTPSRNNDRNKHCRRTDRRRSKGARELRGSLFWSNTPTPTAYRSA